MRKWSYINFLLEKYHPYLKMYEPCEFIVRVRIHCVKRIETIFRFLFGNVQIVQIHAKRMEKAQQH